VAKSKIIVVRLDESLHNFIKRYARYNNMTSSELIRNMIVYFFMAYTLGEIKTPQEELAKKFLELGNKLKLKKLKK